ncbi:MAG TPA: hypothetical protein VGQ83_21165 [Polyangia bacterium]
MPLVAAIRRGVRVVAAAPLLLVPAVLGCLAHGAAPAGPRPPLDLTGTWDWTVEEQNEDGDTRIEREEWHLQQRGKEIGGFYDRVLTVQSGDGRPFECYRNTRYQKFTRFRVAGVADGPVVQLRETDYETRPDPCDGGRRHMTSYTGSVDGPTLTLRWAPSGLQVLKRRSGAAVVATAALTATPAPAPRPVPREVEPPPPPPAPIANAGGVWLWEWRAIDANGDERLEHEEWHVRQRGRALSGHVDRTVRVVAGSGKAWPCSGNPAYTVVTRRAVSGSISGQRVELAETSASQIAGAPCRPESRPLYRYEGELGVEELSLARGLGLRPDKRILRRIRPLALP